MELIYKNLSRRLERELDVLSINIRIIIDIYPKFLFQVVIDENNTIEFVDFYFKSDNYDEDDIERIILYRLTKHRPEQVGAINVTKLERDGSRPKRNRGYIDLIELERYKKEPILRRPKIEICTLNDDW